MLRIHFTHDDLTRVRIARAPDPLAESLLSLSLVQTREAGGVALEGWRSRTRRSIRPELRVLFDLATPVGAVEAAEAFLHAGSHTLPESLEQIWSLPGRRWSADLRTLSRMRPQAARWVYELHRGEREWRELVDRRLREYHAFAVAPYWSQLLAAAHTDRVRRATLAADRGLDGLLDSLHPAIRWRSPVLTLPCPVDADLRLRGAGVMLVPTFFWPEPLALTDNRGLDHPLVLHYPLAPDLTTYRAIWSSAAADGPDGALVALLGTTRARTLRAAADPAGTAELARRTGTSAATASHHAGVLRAAGLLTTERTGPGVRHALTLLGQALLDDRTPDRPQSPAPPPARRDRPEARTPGRGDHRRQGQPGHLRPAP
ncbi:ArsR/SmtB family transcription factor [Kitasatospora sp. NPDC057965]|uniref:ArsR/SmtB family transcription factor n=1 Tax=Kitasatospora sp. NPDC057965 TaxID=3346291 RepID=UPI0036DD6C30